MARAWLELADEEETIDSGDGTSVLVRRTVTQQLDRPVALPVPKDWVAAALVAPRRSPTLYYAAFLLNLLFFFLGAVVFAYGVFDGVSGDGPAQAGAFIMAAAFLTSFAVSSASPDVCTCPQHLAEFGCPPR